MPASGWNPCCEQDEAPKSKYLPSPKQHNRGSTLAARVLDITSVECGKSAPTRQFKKSEKQRPVLAAAATLAIAKLPRSPQHDARGTAYGLTWLRFSRREEYAMPAAYSQDLRQRALKLIFDEKKSISEVSRLLKIARPTLHKWKAKLEETGSTTPACSPPPPRDSAVTADLQKFRSFVDEHKDKTQQEMAELWGGGVSRHVIGRGLKKLGYRRDETGGYRQQDSRARPEAPEERSRRAL